MDVIREFFDGSRKNAERMISFGYRLRNQYTVNKVNRRSKELEWLESLRQYKRLYDPDVIIAADNSRVYPGITRSKINIVLSRLHEMLFPEMDKNYELLITPDPSITRKQMLRIAESLVQENPETGEITVPTEDELREGIRKFAEAACEKMSVVIDDQLTEMDYPEETKKVLRSGLMYGTGVMKGPMVAKRMKRIWKPCKEASGDYEEYVNEEDVPELHFVRIWDWYPDMSVTEYEKTEGSYERHIMTKHDLRTLAKRKDFDATMIEQYLSEHPGGNYVPENWEVDLQVLEVEASAGRTASNRISTAVVGGDDAQRSTNRQMGKKYEVLEFWGYVDGSDLEACGVEVSDVSLEYGANVWLLGDKPIKCDLFEGALDQYKLFYYEKDETSIFGEGLTRIMRHSQIAIAAAARMVLDNGAVCAGPQVEVNWSLTTPNTDLNSFYSRKIWYREGKGLDAQYPAIRVYNIESHIDELLKIVDAFKQFADEETTLPTWMVGQMINNETAQATSGRMSTITLSIKDIVKNFDTFTEKNIRALYNWNMEFNPRSDIKGDYTCKARGVSSLVMKEIRMQALAQLTSTMTDEEREYIPTREFLREKFKAHDLDIKLLSDKEVADNRAAREQSAQSQLMLDQLQAEIGYKKAQTMAQLSKAKKVNVESVIAAQTPPELSQGENPALTEEQLALQQTEREGKEADIRRREEAHILDLQHKQEKHDHDLAVGTVKTIASMKQTKKNSKKE